MGVRGYLVCCSKEVIVVLYIINETSCVMSLSLDSMSQMCGILQLNTSCVKNLEVLVSCCINQVISICLKGGGSSSCTSAG